MKKRLLRMSVSLCLEFEAPFFVKVKAHLRHLGGKVVKVRQANNSTSDSMGGLRLSLFVHIQCWSHARRHCRRLHDSFQRLA